MTYTPSDWNGCEALIRGGRLICGIAVPRGRFLCTIHARAKEVVERERRG